MVAQYLPVPEAPGDHDEPAVRIGRRGHEVERIGHGRMVTVPSAAPDALGRHVAFIQ
jgi:hypothetical protein